MSWVQVWLDLIVKITSQNIWTLRSRNLFWSKFSALKSYWSNEEKKSKVKDGKLKLSQFLLETPIWPNTICIRCSPRNPYFYLFQDWVVFIADSSSLNLVATVTLTWEVLSWLPILGHIWSSHRPGWFFWSSVVSHYSSSYYFSASCSLELRSLLNWLKKDQLLLDIWCLHCFFLSYPLSWKLFSLPGSLLLLPFCHRGMKR